MAAPFRPTSVAVVGALLIVWGGFGLLSTPAGYAMLKSETFRAELAKTPEGRKVLDDMPELRLSDVVVDVVVSAVYVVAGVFLVRRGNWARWLAVAGMVAAVATTALGPTPQFAILSVFIYATMIFFLFTRAANEYFLGTESS